MPAAGLARPGDLPRRRMLPADDAGALPHPGHREITMQLFGRRYRVDWGHLTVLTVMLAITIAYLFDARAVSTSVNNLIMVQPTAILIVLLYLFILPQCFKPDTGAPASDEANPLREIREELPRVGGLAMALLLYALFYERVGFDVATFLFMVVAAFICGERRPHVLVLFAALGAVFVTYAAHFLVVTPVPTTFL